MEVQPDFKDLLELFNAHQVEYMIIGGYALAYHGAPRYTGDIDIYVKPDKHNAQCVKTALDEFGFESVGLKVQDFMNPGMVIQLGIPPVRVDIVTSITGVSWEQACSEKMAGRYGDITVFYIGRDHFILNKLSTGRKKDLADIEALGEDQ